MGVQRSTRARKRRVGAMWKLEPESEAEARMDFVRRTLNTVGDGRNRSYAKL